MDGISEGQIAVDMSTVYPDTSVEENRNYVQNGLDFLDAPVFGSKSQAAEGRLWIVAGGRKEVFDRVRPVFEPLSESAHYLGETGKGASMKLVGNLIVACQIEALGEALVLASKIGLDLDLVLDVIGRTDFQSPILKSVGAQVIERDFTTQYALKHLYKDANLILKLAEELCSPGTRAGRDPGDDQGGRQSRVGQGERLRGDQGTGEPGPGGRGYGAVRVAGSLEDWNVGILEYWGEDQGVLDRPTFHNSIIPIPPAA